MSNEFQSRIVHCQYNHDTVNECTYFV